VKAETATDRCANEPRRTSEREDTYDIMVFHGIAGLELQPRFFLTGIPSEQVSLLACWRFILFSLYFFIPTAR
jgi:hypothetical protein